jgi:hypothetical protein
MARRMEPRRGQVWWHRCGQAAWAVRSDSRLERQGKGVWLLDRLMVLDGHTGWEKGKKEVGRWATWGKKSRGSWPGCTGERNGPEKEIRPTKHLEV